MVSLKDKIGDYKHLDHNDSKKKKKLLCKTR